MRILWVICRHALLLPGSFHSLNSYNDSAYGPFVLVGCGWGIAGMLLLYQVSQRSTNDEDVLKNWMVLIAAPTIAMLITTLIVPGSAPLFLTKDSPNVDLWKTNVLVARWGTMMGTSILFSEMLCLITGSLRVRKVALLLSTSLYIALLGPTLLRTACNFVIAITSESLYLWLIVPAMIRLRRIYRGY